MILFTEKAVRLYNKLRKEHQDCQMLDKPICSLKDLLLKPGDTLIIYEPNELFVSTESLYKTIRFSIENKIVIYIASLQSNIFGEDSLKYKRPSKQLKEFFEFLSFVDKTYHAKKTRGAKKELFLQQKDEIVSQLNSGKTFTQVAKEFGFSRVFLKNMLNEELGKRASDALSKKKSRLGLLHNTIENLLKKSVTRKEIAETIGCNQITLINYLKESGLNAKYPSKIFNVSKEIAKHVPEILNRLRAGEYLKPITRDLGLKYITVKHYMDTHHKDEVIAIKTQVKAEKLKSMLSKGESISQIRRALALSKDELFQKIEADKSLKKLYEKNYKPLKQA